MLPAVRIHRPADNQARETAAIEHACRTVALCLRVLAQNTVDTFLGRKTQEPFPAAEAESA